MSTWRTAVVAAILATVPATAADWPQFGGPNRDGKSAETGLLKAWPAGGPKLLWVSPVKLGQGNSSVSVAGGSIYATGMVGTGGVLFALDLDGKLKWQSSYGEEWSKAHPGARTTPTVDGERLYLMSGMGRAACYDAGTGSELWAVSTVESFGARNITWGIAESPLIADDKVIFTPGGTDATMVALNKLTGRTVWQTRGLSDKSAYCSPIRVRDSARDLIVTMTESHVIGVRTADGAVLWKHPYRGRCQAHANSPIFWNDQVYATSGYDDGGVMLSLSPDGTQAKALWTDKTLDTHHGGVVLVDGYLYGSNWKSNNAGNWVCLEWKTGRACYETAWNNKGSITYADGMLYCYEEKGGNLALVKADPAGFQVVSSFKVPHGSGPHWAHPSISDGRLYVRHGEALMCYDIRAQAAAPAVNVQAARQRVDDLQAQALFRQAEMFLQAEMADQAEPLLRQIVRDYPDSTAAERAAEALRNLK